MEINGYNNYFIYPDGRVSSKRFPNKFLKGGKAHGYPHVDVSKDGVKKTFQIHRLVATHYIPNPDNLPQVDHINRIRSDNRIENLRWVTRSENQQNPRS